MQVVSIDSTRGPAMLSHREQAESELHLNGSYVAEALITD